MRAPAGCRILGSRAGRPCDRGSQVIQVRALLGIIYIIGKYGKTVPRAPFVLRALFGVRAPLIIHVPLTILGRCLPMDCLFQIILMDYLFQIHIEGGGGIWSVWSRGTYCPIGSLKIKCLKLKNPKNPHFSYLC